MIVQRNFRAGGVEGRPTPKDEWRTPPDLYARLDAEFRFVLDAACTSANCLAGRGIYRDLGMDALAADWVDEAWPDVRSRGAIWCNPPYSRIRPWLMRARLAGEYGRVVVLVPADTSTRWWRDMVAQDASEVRFIVGRVRFLTPDGEGHYTKRGGGGLTTPSALVIYDWQGGPPKYSYMEARPPKQARLLLSTHSTAHPRAPAGGAEGAGVEDVEAER